MALQLNHTIVHARDREKSAAFLAEILGLPEPTHFGPFVVVQTANGVSLDFLDAGDAPLQTEHYAFLGSEAEFDEIFGRILARGLDHWADPGRTRPGEIRRRDGSRGVYFLDPDGHLLEILTRPGT